MGDESADEPAEEAAVPESDWPLFRGDPEMQGATSDPLRPPLELAWTHEPPVEEGKRRPPIEATPVIADGVVYVGTQESKFLALDRGDGSVKWEAVAEGPVTAPAAVVVGPFPITPEKEVEGIVCFGDTYGFVYGLDTESGEEIWRFETDGKIEGGVNFLEDGEGGAKLFVGSHDNYLYCIDATTGEELWKYETGNYIVATPSLVKAEGGASVTFGGCDGLLHIVPEDGGEEGVREVEVGSYVANSSAVRDGICYVADNGGEIRAIDIASGEIAWSLSTGQEFIASPAVDRERLYVAGPDKRLVAYDRVMGGEAWAFLTRRALGSSPVVSDGVVWQAGQDGRLYAVDARSGEELWNFELGVQIKASPAISGGTLVLCGEDGIVYAFRSVDGED